MQDSFNILLVDDDPTVIGVLGTILQEFGRLCFATSGEDALRMARQSVPDLILLDIEMPGMSGFEVCAAMKEMPLLMDCLLYTSHLQRQQPGFVDDGPRMGVLVQGQGPVQCRHVHVQQVAWAAP